VIVMPFLRISGDHASWDLNIHPDVDYDLLIDVGAGKTDLFLDDLILKSLDVDTGIGQTIVHLPEQGEYEANINGGLGQVVVFLPDDLGVKLLVDVGIGAIDVPNSFRRLGDAYVSPNFGQAEETIEVDVSLGIGSIEIH
jgi:predicted membrane protein